MRTLRAIAVELLSVMAMTACAASGGASPSATQSVAASASESASTPMATYRGRPTASPTPSPMPGIPVIPDEPTGPVIAGTPVTAEFDDGTFHLTLTADQDRYRAGQLITVVASVIYLGPDDATVGRGSGSSLIGFGVASDGVPINIGPAFTSDCAPYDFVRGVPVDFPFSKSGGFSDGEPLALFYRSYFSSQELRLPAGMWTISAGGTIYIGDCGDELHEPTASVTVIVEP